MIRERRGGPPGHGFISVGDATVRCLQGYRSLETPRKKGRPPNALVRVCMLQYGIGGDEGRGNEEIRTGRPGDVKPPGD